MKAANVGVQVAFQEPEWFHSEMTLKCCTECFAHSNAHNSCKVLAKHYLGGFHLLQLGVCVGWRSEAILQTCLLCNAFCACSVGVGVSRPESEQVVWGEGERRLISASGMRKLHCRNVTPLTLFL